MFVPKFDDGVPMRQTALAEIDESFPSDWVVRVSRETRTGRHSIGKWPCTWPKRVGGWSLTRIGKFYNGRHHTTVCHVIRRIEAFRQDNSDMEGLLGFDQSDQIDQDATA